MLSFRGLAGHLLGRYNTWLLIDAERRSLFLSFLAFLALSSFSSFPINASEI